MSDSTQKSYLRDSHALRVVEAGHLRDKTRGESRRQRDVDDSVKGRSKHSSSRRHTSKSEPSQRRKASSISYIPSSGSGSSLPDRPTFELDVIGQPQTSIPFGTTVETSVLASLRLPSPDMASSYRDLDTSRFMAFVSLVAAPDPRGPNTDPNNSSSSSTTTTLEPRVPAECGSLTGQKMFDSVHSIPAPVAARLARAQPCRLALGYFFFPDLLIRLPGTYRLCVTLIRMGGSAGGTSVARVDSEAIRVERRAAGGRGGVWFD